MNRRRPGVVVAGFNAAPTPETDQLLDLLRVLRRADVSCEVLLVGDGERLVELRALARVSIAHRFGRRGLALLARAVRARGIATALKGKRVTRWVGRRSGSTWILAHPVAATFIRHARTPPSRQVVAPLLDFDPATIAPEDLEVLRHADAWLLRTDAQAKAAVSLGANQPIRLDLLDVTTERAEATDPLDWPVRIVTTPGAWTEINHAIEVAAHLSSRHPKVSVEWLSTSTEDTWLAHHDLRHAMLDDRVRVTSLEDASRLVRLVIHTGYGDGPPGATPEGAPALGFAQAPSGDGRPTIPPFEVGALLQQVDDVLNDPDSIAAARDQADTARRAGVRAVEELHMLAALMEGDIAP